MKFDRQNEHDPHVRVLGIGGGFGKAPKEIFNKGMTLHAPRIAIKPLD